MAMVAVAPTAGGEMIALRGCQLCVLIGLAAVTGGACGVQGESDLEEAVGSSLSQGGSSGAGGSGGAGSPGGASGSGGAPASGRSSGGSAGAGATAAPTETAAFAADLSGFRINYHCSGSPPACVSVMAAAPEADAGVADAGEEPAPPSNDFVAAVFDPGVGEPEPGSARITLQFSADGQLADFARNFGDGMTPGLNLTGKVLTAQARLEAGGAPTVAAKFYIKTGMTYSYADSGETPLVPGAWTTLRYQTPTYVNDAAVYNIADVREIGIELLGRGATAPTATVVHVDTIEY